MTLVVDVRFWSQVSNAPAGIPLDRAESCIEIDDALPVISGRTRMTIPEYNAYQAVRQPAFDAWLVSYRASLDAAEAAAKQARQDAAKPDYATLRDQATQAVIDNNTFLAIGSPSNAQVLAQVRALTQQMNKNIKVVGPMAADVLKAI